MNAATGHCDVIVVGGGSAGLAAAVTAARAGAQVLLVERHGFLGGMGTASLVSTFCGLYQMTDGDQPVYANPGFPVEMAERMLAATGQGPVRMGRVFVLPQHPVEFARIADELVQAESSLFCRLLSEVTRVVRDDDGWYLETLCRGKREAWKARALVDASGDAELAGLLGCAAEQTESARLQRPAYVFGVQGVALADDALRLRTAGWIAEGVRAGCLPKAATGMAFRASGRPGESFATLDLSGAEDGADYDPGSPACLSALESEGRRLATLILGWLRSRATDWQHAFISCWPSRAGVRESRRWRGRCQLLGSQLQSGVRWGDEIALACWPMEFRESTRGPKWRYAEGHSAAGIPLGCLRPVALDDVFVAGRCISVDHDAQASIRVMGTAFATGQAAGLAAALRAEGKSVDDTPCELKRRFGEFSQPAN